MTELDRLFEQDWRWEMNDNPEFAYQAGQYEFKQNVELQSISSAAYKERAKHSRDMVNAVDLILKNNAQKLNSQQRTYAKLFRNIHEELCTTIEECPMYLMPLNSTAVGCLTYNLLEVVEWLRFDTLEDFELYLRKLRAFHSHVDENIECLREGVAKGYVASVDMVSDVESQLNSVIGGEYLKLKEPLQSELAVKILAGTKLSGELELAVEDTKRGFQRFLEFFKTEYSKALRSSPSCSALPNGEVIYQHCLRFHTTTNLTAAEIHAIGLAEVAKIEGRYRDDVLAPLGLGPDDFPAFIEQARGDPRFRVATQDALLDHYRGVLAEIGVALPRYFDQFPRSALELATRTAGPSAFYLAGTADGTRPGRFYVNVSNLEKRALYEAPVLALHEGVPGHHHQVSLAAENEAIPTFLRYMEDRRYEACPCRRNMFSSYVEGWALYCEHLGEEMGAYPSPHTLFGRLSMDMMRAVRLVVDTGMHALGWSAARCIDYMAEKTGRHRHEVETEIRRYAAWPGQAVAYKVGQLEILRLRARAEAALGPAMDLRAWHRVVLGSGPVPLSLLAEMVEEFIAQRRADADATATRTPAAAAEAATAK